MNVNRRLAQMLDAATGGECRALVVEQPGCLNDREQVARASRRWRVRRRSAGAGSTTSGWRQRPTGDGRGEDRPERAEPRTYLSARAARPMPRASPIGTVIRANLNVTTTASRNSLLRYVDVLTPATGPAVLALGVAALLAEPHRPPERVEDEHRQQDQRRAPASARPPAGPASEPARVRAPRASRRQQRPR